MSQASVVPKFANIEEMLSFARRKFGEHISGTPEFACCAPGRVNLIGEHIDYNDGFVLPMALPMITLIIGRRDSCTRDAKIVACNEKDEKFHYMPNLETVMPHWMQYIHGVIECFPVKLEFGFHAVIVGNVPIGAGLSSSASLECAMLKFLEAMTSHQVESDAKRALICQEAEHKYVNMPCGIMDQMISIAGKKDHALLLDCRSLETFQIPFVASDRGLAVLICNSGVRHQLSNSEYPIRRQQCTEALELMGLSSYRDATEDNLSALQAKTTNEILVKRARHVITEIKRTQEAAEALRQHDFKKMGELMTKSHASLRDDFEVSCIEVDVLVETAINCLGVLGSRMTGGGFGGCTVTLVECTHVESVMKAMRTKFEEKFGSTRSKRLEFYNCTPSDGARRVDLTC